MQRKVKHEEKVRVRNLILSCTDSAPRTSQQVRDLMKRGGVEMSSTRIGNNLKSLERDGFVARKKNGEGVFVWYRISAESYDAEEMIGVLFQIPVKVNKELDRLSKMLDISKSEVVREALEEQLGV